MELINPLVQAYAEKFSSPEDTLLKEVADFTNANHPEHQMLSGHLQGKFLEMASMMIRPRRILEIGTFTGYSALCLAKGLTEDGLLHTIELREDDAATAKGFFDRSVYKEKIILHTGDAKEIVTILDDIFDLVFIDADKPGYIEYFNLIFPKLRKNGFIFADNVFFHGQAMEARPKGKNAKAIKEFNAFINKRTDIEQMILTLRDGLCLIRKK
ncbi:MAG TPA: O-methyltransferase [Chitinophagaceae bacterium]|nr:O-methyltransferase [Chitinophagaceae bacterium]